MIEDLIRNISYSDFYLMYELSDELLNPYMIWELLEKKFRDS